MLQEFFRRYEAFLRIDPRSQTSVIVRSRSIYAFGWAFAAIQCLNLYGMTLTYRAWTLDHSIAIAIVAIVLLAIHGLRYSKAFTFYASFLTFLTFAGIFAASLPDDTGINSALLPFLVLSPMLCGFVSGPRLTAACGAASLVAIAFLYFWSSGHPLPDSAYYEPRNLQRAIQVSFAVIMSSAVGFAFSASIFHAFEELEETARRARAAEAAKSRFLATMSHELRTPLNGVLGLTQSLLATELDDDQRHLLRTIKDSGGSLLMILNDILDLSKIDAGRLVIDENDFSTRELLTNLADTWRETASAKDLYLTLHIDAAFPDVVTGDSLRIRQVATNLISNAIKFTEKGGVRIDVRFEPANIDARLSGRLLLTVADTGPGIPESFRGKIFQPFEQAEAAITRSHGGTGLGLSISRELARAMGGDVRLASSSEQGSSFEFSAPVVAVAAPTLQTTVQPAARSEQPAPSNDAALSGVRILLVEDNVVNRMVAERFLASLGATFECAVNGEEGVKKYKPGAVDAILMDKHMPVMDGVEAMRRLRAAGASIPIIACTADAMSGEREKLLGEGFTDFLTKPIRREQLAASLSVAVRTGIAA
ncbi:MAG: response regulator [Alphaproteobacteria bacterium]|nr:response regulator [Alphaproteobacteria bacterium]